MKSGSTLAGIFLGCWLSSAGSTALPPLPATQKQYRHPETAYTDDFTWHTVDLAGLRSAGKLLAWSQPTPETVVLRFEQLDAKLSAPQPGVLRLQLHEPGQEFSWPKDFRSGIRFDRFNYQPLTVRATGDTLAIACADLELRVSRTQLAFTLADARGQTLLTWRDLHFQRTAHGLRSHARFALDDTDHFFGLGGKSSPLDRRGTLADIYGVKVETKRGDYGGFSYPYFLNPRGYGLILNNPYSRVFFDFGYDRPDQWTLTTPDGPLDFFFLAGKTPQQINRRYHALTGAPTIPPKSMFGLWASWFSTATAAEWAEFMQRFRDEKWPVDILVLDLYWRGGMAFMSEGGQGNNLDWDFAKFGDGPALAKKLRDLHIELSLHVNTRMFEEPLRSDGLRRGFLRESGYEQVVSVLESDAARDWNWNLYAPRVREGVGSWWVDNGERVDGTLGNGLPSRNLYGEVWNQFLFERMQRAGLENRLVLARGGWLGTQTNATQWPGDTSPGVERQREDLWFTGNLAMSGVPFTGVDLGGFKADGVDRDIMHTDENIIRRVAHGFLLYAMPRLHNSYRAPHKFPWRYDGKVQAVYRRYLELRYALFPYYYSAGVESAKESIPMIRPLAYDHFNDRRAYLEDDTVLVGPSLLMAPVMETGAHSRYVYLPAGTWFDYWSGEKIAGDRRVLVDAPLYARHGLPIFVKEGALIPSRPPAQFNQEAPEPVIHLDLYPGSATSGQYRLWENDHTFSELSYTQTGDLLALSLANNTGIARTYLLACRDGRHLVEARHEKRLLTITEGRATVTLAPSTTATVQLKLR